MGKGWGGSSQNFGFLMCVGNGRIFFKGIMRFNYDPTLGQPNVGAFV